MMTLGQNTLLTLLLLALCGPAVQAQTVGGQPAVIDEALQRLLGDADINDFLETRRSTEIRDGRYQVRTGDTLDQLIERMFGASLLRRELLQQAIMRANPHAFRNGNPNWMLAGAQLRVPTADDVLGLIFSDLEGVRTRIRGGHPNWVQYP